MKQQRLLLIILIALFTVAIGVGMYSAFSRASVPVAAKEGNEGDGTSVSEIVGTLTGKTGDGIGLIKVYGPIYTPDSASVFDMEKTGSDSIVKRIKRMRDNKHVKAILVRVNSPGGTIGASQEISAELIKAKDAGLPVVVSMGDLAASGGYYISAGASKIVANAGTITGSIGVIIGTLNLKEFGEKLGISMNVIKSGPHKDILSSWRDLTEEERALLQSVVDSAYNQFVGVVSKGRNIPADKVKQFADGRVVTGEQAKELGLVDEIGTYEDALKLACTLAGLPEDAPIIRDRGSDFERIFEFLDASLSTKKESVAETVLGKEIAFQSPLLYYFPGL